MLTPREQDQRAAVELHQQIVDVGYDMLAQTIMTDFGFRPKQDDLHGWLRDQEDLDPIIERLQRVAQMLPRRIEFEQYPDDESLRQRVLQAPRLPSKPPAVFRWIASLDPDQPSVEELRSLIDQHGAVYVAKVGMKPDAKIRVYKRNRGS